MSIATRQYAYDTLYAPDDVERCYKAWRASCGPCALAAILGVLVERVRRVFPDFDRRPWVNPSTMWTAISLAGHRAIKRGIQWPTYGLAFVQWHGPWLQPGVPVGAAYRHTHWIAVAETFEYGRMIYDVNTWGASDKRGAWVPMCHWDEEVTPLIAESIPRATGEWSLRWTCELVRPAKEGGC